MKNYLLKGKTAVVTGCNRGIGKSIFEKFVENGANCIACVRKSDAKFEDYCKSLSSKNNVNNYHLIIHKHLYLFLPPDFERKIEICNYLRHTLNRSLH